jgi:chromosome partitioning protein
MIVVLAQTKGGVGKSTLAVNFAVERSRARRDVLLVDADDQATATDFTALRTEHLGAPGYTAVSLSIEQPDVWTFRSGVVRHPGCSS